MNEKYLRQLDVVKPTDFPPILLIGAGGIGSFTALALTKMGVSMLNVIDDDKIEEHNLPNQLYGINQLHTLKITSLYDICRDLSGTLINASPERITEFSVINEQIVISGVDSMKARSDIWNAVKNNYSKHPEALKWYIDARMGLEVIRLYTVKPDEDTKWYEGTLYSDNEAEMAPCTARSIIYTGFVVAGLIATQVKKIVKEEDYYNDITFDLKNLMIVTSLLT